MVDETLILRKLSELDEYFNQIMEYKKITGAKSEIPNREFHPEISVRSTSSFPMIPTSLPATTTGRV